MLRRTEDTVMVKTKEFKVTDPWDYKAPTESAQVLTLPERRFVWIEGQGDPNGKNFAQATGALYSLSYAVRMSYRAEKPPEGASAYTVGLLQGKWDLREGETVFDPKRKDKLAWIIMIRQPDFLTTSLFQKFVEEARAKAVKKGEIDPKWFDRLRLGPRDGGRFAQIMHRGPYDEEPGTFARLEGYLAAQGLSRSGKFHWEIYHGDPRRTAPEKLRTLLRVQLA
jgi:hypothetical protein